MGTTTGIQWTDHTFNPWIGCTKVSPECDNCYADAGSRRLAAQHRLTLWGDDSSRYMTGDTYWSQPARWDRAAVRAGVRRKVFCASFSDVFEDRPELVDRRARLMGIIEATQQLDWLLLTKRPGNMVSLGWGLKDWPSNVWAGTTVGTRESVGRLDALRWVPARVRFVSAEPLLEDLGDVDLTWINWVIIGGESGPSARPFAIEWGERLAARSRNAGAAVFWKQLGSNPVEPDVDGSWIRIALKDRHGGDMSEWPADLTAREFPS